MSSQDRLQQFLSQLSENIASGRFVKLSLGNYQGQERDLKNIYVKKVIIKRNDMLSFTYRYKTKDIFKNFQVAEGIQRIGEAIGSDFKICTLFCTEKEIIAEYNKKGEMSLREQVQAKSRQPDLLHDRAKKRLITPDGKSYLQELGITDHDDRVFKNAQDKYRQINQYIEILNSLIRELPDEHIQKVVDMGAGKGYLTFALYDYLHHTLKSDSCVTGVEYREDLVNLCNGIAERAGFSGLNFVQGTIDAYQAETIDLLIALHACDTATDDAIYKGITADAKLIVVAPCCHKQIRKEMEKGKARNDVSFLTRYGIFMERQAEMVTDGIRALILEYFGYKTKVFEFISDAHTPKNVLIVGIKTLNQNVSSKTANAGKLEIKQKISEIKARFGITYHHLERRFGLEA